MQLKQYQQQTLAVLRRYLEQARMIGAAAAYGAITQEAEQAQRLGRYRGDYTALEALPETPYICLRLPTGGGKTILGAHAIAIARDAWVEKDYPLVLWLVPSNTIRQQTVEAFRNPRHPYRQVLDAAFNGRVRVFDIGDFTQIRPHDIRDNCCVVVGTIQTLRVSNTEGRKVYANHEDMEAHFAARRHFPEELERAADGKVKFSFANLLHLHRPLMIVDEAHNAVTGLSRDMQARVNPSAIIEFTATPRFNSNILHSVQAQELKLEEMIKLPIVLSENDSWQSAVSGAVMRRAELAALAQQDANYIRPIVLLQAQPKNQEVTVEVLKQYLMDAEAVPEQHIVVATGDQRGLDGLNLFDPACPVEFVITIEALKEGWDCSFAYIFCSVSRIRSAEYVEQLLGRVLRMPYAKRRNNPDLNKAYAFLSEPGFGEAARALTDKLVAMGFDEAEAQDNIEAAQGTLELTHGLFAPRDQPPPIFRHTLTLSPEQTSTLAAHPGIAVERQADGQTEIAITGMVAEEVAQFVAATLPAAERQGFAEAMTRYRVAAEARLSPAERGVVFSVPRLMAEIQGHLEFADTDTFMESHDWSLLDLPARLEPEEFSIHETARSFHIDLAQGRVVYQFFGEDETAALDLAAADRNPQSLVLALQPHVRHIDIHHSELLRWLRDLVGHLHDQHGFAITTLLRCKFILARKINEKIAAFRQQQRDTVYQRHLFGPAARPMVSFDSAFEFSAGMYRDQVRYRGRWQPTRHFLGPGNLPAFSGATDGEEFQCAQALDSLPGVDCWIRNVSQHPASFWLPTATDKFYPDFVAKLTDGRLLVVEYKGEHLAQTSDTNEKRLIGELWQRQSGGHGLFVIVEKQRDGRDMRRQLLDKIG